MKIIPGGVTAPAGFRAAGLHVGIRRNKLKKDMALLVSDVPAHVAGAFTQNMVQAAPVIYDRRLCQNVGMCQALVVNSGVANTCTGEQGIHDAEPMAAHVGKSLGIDPSTVAVASTGVIGMRLPMDVIQSGIDMLVPELSYSIDAGVDAAEAIKTTDIYKKEIAVTLEIKGQQVTIGGMCKGSGMINPNLGTVLSFITTDLNISSELLGKVLKSDVVDTYNMVSVDGDMSTNDTVMIFANGMAGNEELLETDDDFPAFVEAIRYINRAFVRAIASDGEGATKLLVGKVTGAETDEIARTVAKSVICSSLVKAAMFGADANWGRVLCAIGYSGAQFDPKDVEVKFLSRAGELLVCAGGQGVAFDEALAKRVLSEDEVVIQVTLTSGSATCSCWGCDLTYDYVKINGDYRS